jgi:hypothetical protein
MEVICEAAVANAIAEHVMTTDGRDFGIALFFADVQVLRPHKF